MTLWLKYASLQTLQIGRPANETKQRPSPHILQSRPASQAARGPASTQKTNQPADQPASHIETTEATYRADPSPASRSGPAPNPGPERCADGLRFLNIRKVEVPTVLQLDHLNVKNTKEKPQWIGAHESSADGTPQCQKHVRKFTTQAPAGPCKRSRTATEAKVSRFDKDFGLRRCASRQASKT